MWRWSTNSTQLCGNSLCCVRGVERTLRGRVDNFSFFQCKEMKFIWKQTIRISFTVVDSYSVKKITRCETPNNFKRMSYTTFIRSAQSTIPKVSHFTFRRPYVFFAVSLHTFFGWPILLLGLHTFFFAVSSHTFFGCPILFWGLKNAYVLFLRCRYILSSIVPFYF